MIAVLTREASDFVARLQRLFGGPREALLRRREEVQRRIDAGWTPDFPSETAGIRQSEWKVAPVPADLRDRRVEITGPVDRKMIIHALNSGAQVFMADFEDSHSPTWAGTLQGQLNLRDAVDRTIEYRSSDGTKHYRLNERTAVLMVRPRGWHLTEDHHRVDGSPVSASLFDFGLFLFHNARKLVEQGSGPYFYLPKLENRLEARLWRDVFAYSERELGLRPGTIRCTVLIETVLAAFEMHEILYELRQYCTGLNCGRWDYIFSTIKKFRNRADFVTPDRSEMTMSQSFLKAYSLLLIQTCHRRGAHAMGGMAAQIPLKGDPRGNERAMALVREDKQREADNGHDGTWVAHPALVSVAREPFDRVMKGVHQLQVLRSDVDVRAHDLLTLTGGAITERGLRTNLEVSLRYLAAWLRGTGSVAIHGLMEDAATVEISRSQVWQWIRHPKGVLADGRRITIELFRDLLSEEYAAIRREFERDPEEGADRASRLETLTLARDLLDQVTVSEDFVPFITLPAYEALQRLESRQSEGPKREEIKAS